MRQPSFAQPVWQGILTVMGEGVELWHVLGRSVGVTRVGEAGIWIPQFIEEGVDHGINGRKTLRRGVFEQLRDQIDCLRIRLPKDLGLGLVSETKSEGNDAQHAPY